MLWSAREPRKARRGADVVVPRGGPFARGFPGPDEAQSTRPAGEDAIDRNLRVNEQIRISPVRVINTEGELLGVMPTGKAMESAREAGLDLVEVAPNERPPVCKIMDFGKFKYSQKKRASKQKQHQVQVKEIRVRPKTGDHDIEVKVKRAREFLEHKDKVLVNVLFRGRELAHIDEGRKVMNEVLQALDDVAKIEKNPSMEGKRMTAIIAPRAS
jgi:translation initiation factor IF-3